MMRRLLRIEGDFALMTERTDGKHARRKQELEECATLIVPCRHGEGLFPNP
jgi:hypothetical protein